VRRGRRLQRRQRLRRSTLRTAGCRIDAAPRRRADRRRLPLRRRLRGDAAFVHLLARSSADSDCADAFAAWTGCQLETGPCDDGHAEFYGIARTSSLV